jgi:hypothetical protein
LHPHKVNLEKEMNIASECNFRGDAINVL